MTFIDGIDVSLWQGDITPALKGQAFCVVKVSQAGYGDPSRKQHMASVRAAGIVLGAYHWLDPQPSAITQVKSFLDKAGDADFLALDVEGRILRNLPLAQQMARDFIAYVHANDKRKILLYSSEGTWPGSLGQDANWIANYSAQPGGILHGIEWAIWQHGGTGIDRNYSTQQQLDALVGHTTPPAGEPMTNLFPLTTHRVVDLPAGAVLQKTPGGERFTTLSKPVTLGLLGATSTHFHVADGDRGVYVARTGLATRVADINAGK